MFRPARFALLLFLGVSALALAQTAPAGLDRVLRGAGPGTLETEFKAAHPKAALVQAPADTPGPAAPQSASSYSESFESDPLLGLECHANYGFKDKKLKEFVVLWGGSQEVVRKDNKEFLEACMWKHGRGFRRDVIQINQRTPNPRMVPVLVWETAQATYLASLAWNPESERAAGTFSYSMYGADDPFVDIVLLGDELAPEVIDDAFAELDPLLKELESIGKR